VPLKSGIASGQERFASDLVEAKDHQSDRTQNDGDFFQVTHENRTFDQMLQRLIGLVAWIGTDNVLSLRCALPGRPRASDHAASASRGTQSLMHSLSPCLHGLAALIVTCALALSSIALINTSLPMPSGPGVNVKLSVVADFI
jgi:hypothetical protein